MNFEMIGWRQNCYLFFLLHTIETQVMSVPTLQPPGAHTEMKVGKNKKNFQLAHTQSVEAVNVQEIQYWLRYRSSNETVVIVTTLRPTFANLSAVTVRACLCSDKSCQWNYSVGGCSLSTCTPVRVWRLEPGSSGVGVAASVKMCDDCSQ